MPRQHPQENTGPSVRPLHIAPPPARHSRETCPRMFSSGSGNPVMASCSFNHSPLRGSRKIQGAACRFSGGGRKPFRFTHCLHSAWFMLVPLQPPLQGLFNGVSRAFFRWGISHLSFPPVCVPRTDRRKHVVECFNQGRESQVVARGSRSSFLRKQESTEAPPACDCAGLVM